jgi:hypothetical protein
MAKDQNEKLMKNIKKLEDKNKVLKSTMTAEDECFEIIQAIWSCKSDEQKEGCVNMFETYKKKHGEENIGITFIKLELKRLDQIIRLSKLRQEQMQKMQDAMAKDKQDAPEPSDEKLKKEFNNGNIIPMNPKEMTKTSKKKK